MVVAKFINLLATGTTPHIFKKEIKTYSLENDILKKFKKKKYILYK